MWLSLWRCCLEDDVFVVERFDEMLLRWRGDVVVGAVVGVAWLLRCGCGCLDAVVVVEMRLFQNKDSKRIILPQRSQPGYTNNSL